MRSKAFARRAPGGSAPVSPGASLDIPYRSRDGTLPFSSCHTGRHVSKAFESLAGAASPSIAGRPFGADGSSPTTVRPPDRRRPASARRFISPRTARAIKRAHEIREPRAAWPLVSPRQICCAEILQLRSRIRPRRNVAAGRPLCANTWPEGARRAPHLPDMLGGARR